MPYLNNRRQPIHEPCIRHVPVVLDRNQRNAKLERLNFNHYYLGGLHSAYVRGRAFVAAKRYPEAAAEFQKILDHRGLAGLDPIGTLAHLQLGRSFALSGDNAKAKSAYQDFFALWKDADPDIPILKQAKAEYAMLQ